MEKCVYNGEILYAYQVLQNFDFEQKIRSCHVLTCCDCGAPVFFKHGKQRTECFAHYKREECKYSDYCSKQSNIFKYVQRELYIPLQKIAENRGFQLEEDVIIIHDHYTAFVMRSESVKFAIDIIDTATTSATLDKRNRLYEEAGYQYLQITVDKNAESEPFSERDMAYFPVKYALNRSHNHTAVIIDKEYKNWFIYILDDMDISDVPDNFYDFPDWFAYDTFAMPIAIEDIDISENGFYTSAAITAFSDFCNARRAGKARWIQEDTERRELQRRLAEEARKQAEFRRQKQERRLKETEMKRQQEAEARRKAAETAKIQAEKRKQQRATDEKTEIQRIHATTGGYVGSKIKGRYEILSLEELTSTKPGNWLCAYTRAEFEAKIMELREFKASAVKMLFAKMCYINQEERVILLQILEELKSTDSETARVIEYLMQRAGI